MIQIRLIRERRRVSQKELAKHLNITPSMMCLIEKGKRRINAEMLKKAADYLGVDVSNFHETPDYIQTLKLRRWA